LEGELLNGAMESLQIVEEFSKSMQNAGVPLRVIWIASGCDERLVTAVAKELLSDGIRLAQNQLLL